MRKFRRKRWGVMAVCVAIMLLFTYSVTLAGVDDSTVDGLYAPGDGIETVESPAVDVPDTGLEQDDPMTIDAVDAQVESSLSDEEPVPDVQGFGTADSEIEVSDDPADSTLVAAGQPTQAEVLRDDNQVYCSKPPRLDKSSLKFVGQGTAPGVDSVKVKKVVDVPLRQKQPTFP